MASKKGDKKAAKRKWRERQRQKNVEQLKAAAGEKLLERVRQEEEFLNREYVVEPTGEVKMSEVIVDFIRPLLMSLPTYRMKKNLIRITIMAWNICQLPEKDRQKVFNETESKVSSEDTQLLKSITAEMADYKRRHYPHLNRYIVDFELTDAPDDIILNVASILPKPKQ